MANSESPKANETPRNPILSPASTALPQPPKTSTKVPTASARYRFIACSPRCHAPRRREWPNTPGVGVLPLGHVYGCRVTCAPGDDQRLVALGVPPYLPP